MNEHIFPLHKPARTSFIILAVLLALLCVTLPLTIYILVRLGSMRVRLTARGLEAKGLTSDEVVFDEVERFGVLRIPMRARGLGGVVANMKLNNMNEGVNLVFLMKNGKTVKFISNQFERHDELIQRVTEAVRVPKETIEMGLLNWKWPEKK